MSIASRTGIGLSSDRGISAASRGGGYSGAYRTVSVGLEGMGTRSAALVNSASSGRTGGTGTRSAAYARSGSTSSRSGSTGSRSTGTSSRSGGTGSRSSGGTSRGRSSSGGSRGTASGRSSGGYSRSGYGSSGTGSRNYRSHKRKKSPDYRIIAIVGVIMILVITAVAFAMTQNPGRSGLRESGSQVASETTPSEPETELQKEVKVDGITITGMSREQAKEAILKNYPWKMTASCQGDTYELANLMSGKVDLLLDEIFTGSPKESYTLDTSGLEGAIASQVAAMRDRWNKEPKNGTISGYDADSDSFIFAEGENGVAINEEKLAADIQAAIDSKDFDARISVETGTVEPEISRASAESMYKILSTYTTNTTSNSKRNTNVRLAAEYLNGTIVQPGEELSFNETVGERTEEKGYQSAAAYNNGEVVQEIGGGVCQVSTTLYNAVVRAGLTISRRQSHTFEPTYVTPGMDATVSWNGPDFKFVNNSRGAIGIWAKYSNQTMTVSVYGIPILEEGVTYSLESTKLSDSEPEPPVYQEDQTVPLDQEITVSAGSLGSKWETRLIIKKDGEIISNEVDHRTTYKGHAAVIRRNTSGVVIPAEEETEPSEAESSGESGSSSANETSAGESVPVGPGSTGSGTSSPGENVQPSPGEAGAGPSGGPGSMSPVSPDAGPGFSETQPSMSGLSPDLGPGGQSSGDIVPHP